MKNSILKEKNLIFFTLITCFIQVIALIFSEIQKGIIIDSVFNLDLNEIYKEFIVLIALVIAMIVFGYLYAFSRTRFVQKVTADLRDKFFSGFFNRNIKEQFSVNKSELLTRYNVEIGSVERQFLTMLTLFVEMVLQISLIVFALARINLYLAISSLLILSIPIAVPKFFEKQLEKVSKDRKLVVEGHISRFISWLNSFELIKNYEIEEKLKDKFKKSNKKYLNMDLKFNDESAKNIGLSFLLSLGAQALIIITSGLLLLNSRINLGEFVTVTGLVGNLRIPTYWISTYYQMIISTRPVRKSLDNFIKSVDKEEIKDKKLIENESPRVHYNHVSYSYNKEDLVLKNVKLELNGYKKVLVTGKSGSGKTTLVNLLLNYDKADFGEVKINGLDVNEIGNLEDYITVSRQEAILFNDSLRNNLTMYNDEIEDENLIKTLKILGLIEGENFSSLDEIIQEDGSNFSGGEKKRISLARALLKTSKILILDEPLANIDKKNLEKIEDVILGLENKLVIVISHQFNKEKLKEFDLILNCKEGKVYEEVYS